MKRLFLFLLSFLFLGCFIMGSAIVIVGVNDASEGLPYNDGTDKYAGSPDASFGDSPTDESDLWTNDGNYAFCFKDKNYIKKCLTRELKMC